MLEYTGQNPAAAQVDVGSYFRTICILRIGAGVLLAVKHGWQAAIDGYQFVWKEMPWDWVTALGELKVPYPHIVAPAAAVVLCAVSLSWMAGFLTRLFAVVFLPLGIGALVLAQKAHHPMVETCWLYLLVAATLLLFGSGNLSLDGVFKLGSRFKKKPRH